MSTLNNPVSYNYEFIDQVPEEYYCKQCKHVAREPTIASCCTEIFCKLCLEAAIKEEHPCPSCESKDIGLLGPHKKFNTRILSLKVHCSLKSCGCEWTDQLQHLDAHLDLSTGDCVYVDVDCPKGCERKLQKRNVDTHISKECPNRDRICQHCSFSATFRDVFQHFDVCRYYPIVCPNRCGATFERDDLEDHMKMCSQQKIQCEFNYAGCEAEFIRDKQREHMEQTTQKHLALIAATTLRIGQTFEIKLQEQQQTYEQMLQDKDSEIEAIANNIATGLMNEQAKQIKAEKQQTLEQAIQNKESEILNNIVHCQQREFEQKFRTQQQAFKQMHKEQKQEVDQKLQQQQKAIDHALRNLQRTQQKFQEQYLIREQKLREQLLQLDDKLRKELENQQEMFELKFGEVVQEFHKRLEQKEQDKEAEITSLKELVNNLNIAVGILPCNIQLSDFKAVKESNGHIESNPMYTHPGGYKFFLRILPNGAGSGTATHVSVQVFSLKGDHDDTLTFPAKFYITVELMNQNRDQDHYSKDIHCTVISEKRDGWYIGCDDEYIALTELTHTKNDCLKFKITKLI